MEERTKSISFDMHNILPIPSNFSIILQPRPKAILGQIEMKILLRVLNESYLELRYISKA